MPERVHATPSPDTASTETAIWLQARSYLQALVTLLDGASHPNGDVDGAMRYALGTSRYALAMADEAGL